MSSSPSGNIPTTESILDFNSTKEISEIFHIRWTQITVILYIWFIVYSYPPERIKAIIKMTICQYLNDNSDDINWWLECRERLYVNTEYNVICRRSPRLDVHEFPEHSISGDSTDRNLRELFRTAPCGAQCGDIPDLGLLFEDLLFVDDRWELEWDRESQSAKRGRWWTERVNMNNIRIRTLPI